MRWITNRVAAIAFLFAVAVACAQGTADEPRLLDGLTPTRLQIGGQTQGRLEIPAGPDLVARSAHPYVLTPVRLTLAIHPLSWLKFFAEGQDTRAIGYNGTAPASLQDPVDLRAACVEVKHGEDHGAMVRVGRQGIGSSRLISIGPWSNTSKSFGADAYNLFNRHAGQTSASQNINSATFGGITPFQINGSRQLQLKLRIDF